MFKKKKKKKSSVLQDCPPPRPHPLQKHNRYLCFQPTGYKSEVPMTPFWGLINLLEMMAHKTQRNSLLTRSPVYYKKIKLRNSQMEERHRPMYCERMQLLRSLQACHFPQISSDPETLQTLSFWVFMDTSLHRPD